MFDVGWSELLVIGVVALIAIGPKELPGVLRSVGQWVTKIRSMAAEFQGQFQEALREAEVADLKKQVDDITGNLNTPFDPTQTIDSNWTPDKPAETTVATAPPAGDDSAAPATAAEPAAEPPVSAVEPPVPAVDPPVPAAATPEPEVAPNADGSRP
jgi:sec-independent protein translocase protein TatB